MSPTTRKQFIGALQVILGQDFDENLTKANLATLSAKLAEQGLGREACLEYLVEHRGRDLQEMTHFNDADLALLTEDEMNREVSIIKAAQVAQRQVKEPKVTGVKGLMWALIQQGIYSRRAIIENTLNHFPDMAKSTVTQYLADGKNPKYQVFPTLIAEVEGIVRPI